ncbi:MAG: tetratricopeptide repeat protein [Terracidiphilus sp.]
MLTFSRSRFRRAARIAATAALAPVLALAPILSLILGALILAGLILAPPFAASARGQSRASTPNAGARVATAPPATTAATTPATNADQSGQQPASLADSASPTNERILLVLPFDNRTGQFSLDWMREAAAELLNSRFASAGFAPLTREDRMYALDHLGLPQGFQPSRASSIKLAQTLDADQIVVGSFSMDGSDLVAEAQLVDVPHLRMTEPVSSRGKLTSMIAIFDSLAWKLTRELDPGSNVGEQTFVAAGASLRLDAFEQYIRGITDPDQSERLAHLESAVKLSPDFSPAWMALGREEYATQEYDKAAGAFAKVDRNGPDGLEAGFYRGLSLLFSGDYAQAEQSFAGVARILPLAEVLNNQGVALSREGRDGTALFVRAAAADPTTADYHFNLAVSLKQHGNSTGAVSEIKECIKLHPGDEEAQSLLDAWTTPAAPQPTVANAALSAPAAESNPDPLERIARTFDAAAFRQAAAVMDEMDAARLAALPAPERARKLCAEARDYLKRGLILEAERLYQSAVAADPNSADAHAGLAEVRLRSGDTKAASDEVALALKLAPSNAAALDLERRIAAKQGAK